MVKFPDLAYRRGTCPGCRSTILETLRLRFPLLTLVIGTASALFAIWRICLIGFEQLSYDATRSSIDDAMAAIMREGPAPSAEAIWRAWIVGAPTNAKWYLGLGLELEKEGKAAEARTAIDEAMRLGSAHPYVNLEAAKFYLRSGDTARAYPILQRRIELNPEFADEVWPLYLAELESDRGRAYLSEQARDNPSWFPEFFRHVCQHAADPALATKLFDLRASAGVISDEERDCLIGRMQRERRWAEAYRLWAESLPKAAAAQLAPVFNGGFEWPLSNRGFDWMTPPQDGAKVEQEAIDGRNGALALRISFLDKRYSGPPIYQYLMLHPGPQTLLGRARIDAVESWLGLQWAIYCVADDGSDSRQLVRTEQFVGNSDWTNFRREFAVPEDCPMQILRLELANPNRNTTTPGNVAVRLRGALGFDDLAIDSTD